MEGRERQADNWRPDVQALDHQTSKTTISLGARLLTTGEVLQLWQENETFARSFTSMITQSAFDAFFWETPPLTSTNLDRPFEFVLVSAPSLLGLLPDPLAFAKHFRTNPSEQIVTFSNLGGDATLVVPTPQAEHEVYAHLASFLRRAPEQQSSALWRHLGRALSSRLSSAPIWLSTAGMGVSWLHVRLDSQPKYFRHTPYRRIQ